MMPGPAVVGLDELFKRQPNLEHCRDWVSERTLELVACFEGVLTVDEIAHINASQEHRSIARGMELNKYTLPMDDYLKLHCTFCKAGIPVDRIAKFTTCSPECEHDARMVRRAIISERSRRRLENALRKLGKSA